MLPVGGDDFFYDRESQAGPFFVFSPGGVGLVEAFPDFFHAVPGDAYALILDGDEDLLVPQGRLDGDLGIVGAELDGVVQKVVQDLLDFSHIRGDELLLRVEEELDGDMAVPALALEGGDGVFDDRIDVEIGDVQAVLLGVKGI